MIEEESDEGVLYRIGHIPVKEINYVRLKLNEHEYKRLAEIAVSTGIAVSGIIALLCMPCTICGNDTVNVAIPKGVLSTKKNNGRPISNRLKNGKQD